MKKVLLVFMLLISISSVTLAHGGNISGWNNRESDKITEYNGKNYGYHNENGERHYHEVTWNSEKSRWEIIKSAVYYDENFNIIERENKNTEKVKVTFVASIDGDTAKFVMNNEKVTARFLGVDTPETVHPTKEVEEFGKEASDFTKKALENAAKIELEFDVNADKKDKYNRYLAWVWVDDVLLQKELVENGLASVYMLKDSYAYAGILQQAEEAAKNYKIGIWSNEGAITNIYTNETMDNKQEQNITHEATIVICVALVTGAILVAIKNRK